MAISAGNSFKTRDRLSVGAQTFDIHRLEFLEKKAGLSLAKLPFSLRILLENLLRNEDGRFVRADDIRALALLETRRRGKRDRLHASARVAAGFYRRAGVVDLAAMREAMKKHGRQSRSESIRFSLPSW